MLGEDELLILSLLRNNSRMSLAEMSRATGIPTTTVFSKIKKLEEKVIRRHVSLVDFPKLNYGIKVNFVLKLEDKNNQDFLDFIKKSQNINTFFKINNGYDYMVESIFSNMAEMAEFSESIDDFGLVEKNMYHVIEEVKKEGFMSDINRKDKENNIISKK